MASEVQCVAVYCRVLQCVAVCGTHFDGDAHLKSGGFHVASVLQCVVACCSVLQCVAHTGVFHVASVMQCVTVCCSVL